MSRQRRNTGAPRRSAGFGEGTPQQDWPGKQMSRKVKFGPQVESCPKNSDVLRLPSFLLTRLSKRAFLPAISAYLEKIPFTTNNTTMDGIGRQKDNFSNNKQATGRNFRRLLTFCVDLNIINHMMQNNRFSKKRGNKICRQKQNSQEMKLLKQH